MEKLTSEQYYNSNQEWFIDEENLADCARVEVNENIEVYYPKYAGSLENADQAYVQEGKEGGLGYFLIGGFHEIYDYCKEINPELDV